MVNFVLKTRFLMRLAWALMVVLASSLSAAEVTAQLDRDSVPAGSGAFLTITVAGSRDARPEIPQIENLIFQSRGQSQQFQMFNGRTTMSVTYTYAVGSNVPGDYEIPAIEIVVSGKKLSTKPLRLRVLDASAARPPAGIPASPQGALPLPEEDQGEGKFGFLTVELADTDRKHVYVGEIAPVRIRAWLPAESRAQLRSGVQPEGKAFTLHNVSGQPQQAEEIKDGKRYLVVTWYGGMSATKAGKYPASLSLDATIAVRDPSAQRRSGRRAGPFGDPFFDSIFDNMNVPMIQKDVTLKSDDQEIEVRSLPAEDRPTGFTGTVGKFKFDEVKIPARWASGEPQQMAARLTGTGNFSLMDAPAVRPAGAWKTYPGKGDFAAGDEASFSGSKTFQFSAVPRKAGEQEVALEFSFFDPEEAAYKTISSAAKTIVVTGEDMVEDEPAVAVEADTPAKNPEVLIGQHSEAVFGRGIVPLVSRPMFYQLLVLAALLGVLGKVLALLRVRRNDPRRIALAVMEKATHEALEASERCAKAGDIPGYFAASRLAIQQRLGVLWNQPAQAITLAEIDSRIPDDSPVARFFREADRHEYSRQSAGEIQPAWRVLLDEALKYLTPSVPRK